MEFVNDGSKYPKYLKISKVSVVDNGKCAEAYKNLKVNLQFYENSTHKDQQIQMIYCIENGSKYGSKKIIIIIIILFYS